MKIVRPGVFETNSSSSHSLSIENNSFDYYLEDLSFLINENGDIWLDCGGVNLQEELEHNPEIVISGALDKIAFLFALWNSYVEDIYNIYKYDDLIDFIKRNTLCEKIYVYNIGNIDLAIGVDYKFDFIPTDKEELYEFIFSSNRDIFVVYEEHL